MSRLKQFLRSSTLLWKSLSQLAGWGCSAEPSKYPLRFNPFSSNMRPLTSPLYFLAPIMFSQFLRLKISRICRGNLCRKHGNLIISTYEGLKHNQSNQSLYFHLENRNQDSKNTNPTQQSMSKT